MNLNLSNQGLREAALADKYALDEGQIYLTGIQALVRLPIMQAQRDRGLGLNTAGFISGYRGSPLGALDQQLDQASQLLQEQNIKFLPAVNEELAATSIWGAQQAELQGRGRYDGVYCLWYGKGPGVDRSGDAFRHGNLAGSSKHGGVLVVMGDDHTAESSTTVHQSEFGMINVLVPVLNPAGVRDVIEFGLLGWMLSRYSGCWVGLKCVHDTIESSASISVSPTMGTGVSPLDFEMPMGGLNIRSNDGFLDQESRLHRYKLPAVNAFVRANKLNRIIMGDDCSHTGIITTGKSYLDVRRALFDLGIDESKARKLGLRLYKVAMSWPLEPHGVVQFANGLERIIVVEEKRGLMEDQVKSILYAEFRRPEIVGKKDEQGAILFDVSGRLESSEIAAKLSRYLRAADIDQELAAKIQWIEEVNTQIEKTAPAMLRTPYFCAGCPHNSSTIVPDNSRALAGIGCHFMAQWMDRNTSNFTQMGGEGAGWVGEAPFSMDEHVFQNVGDGTYFHSGILAIRAAVAAKTNITFKLLYNDAVAMTGGQQVDSQLDVPRITRQVDAEGARKIVVVTDEPGKYSPKANWATGVKIYHRQELQLVQSELKEVKGTTVLVYDQTCAAEKRRRRRRGVLATPKRRVLINEGVCEGCGDCGVQSNCVALTPTETPFGRKRAIDQSACNMDYSCLDGFCPSFVSVIGGELQTSSARDQFEPLLNSLLLEPDPSAISGSYSIVLTGVGGTGVVTVGALLGMAAHLAGKGCSVLDMAGLAQKGGAVTSHIILAETPDIELATHVADGTADLLLGCDLVTAASIPTLRKLHAGTLVIVNTHPMMSGDFTRDPNAVFPSDELLESLSYHVGRGRIHGLEASRLAAWAFSDSIAANILILGYAYQLGGLPIPSRAIERAIELNGRSVDMNLTAFKLGRIAATRSDDIRQVMDPSMPGIKNVKHETLDQIVDRGERFLTNYQNSRLGSRYRQAVEKISAVETSVFPDSQVLSKAVAQGYRKVLAYKDEFEVARLLISDEFQDSLNAQFKPGYKLHFHLAPPIFSKIDVNTQRPIKKEFGSWMIPLFHILAACRFLRGTGLDPFRHSSDRKLERDLLSKYEASIEKILDGLSARNFDIAVSIAAMPMEIRGYGPVKEIAAKAAQSKEDALWKKFSTPKESEGQAAA